MGLLILAAAGGLVWAWSTGRLRHFTYEDGVAAVVFLLGLRLLTTGRIGFGAILMTGAILWGAHRRRSAKPAMPLGDARALLGVGENASIAEIREAHRRLIARVHPDAGGSTELANRVNAARDILIADLTRRTPTAR